MFFSLIYTAFSFVKTDLPMSLDISRIRDFGNKKSSRQSLIVLKNRFQAPSHLSVATVAIPAGQTGLFKLLVPFE